MKRVVALLTVAVVLAVAGCSSSDDDAATTEDTQAQATEDTQAQGADSEDPSYTSAELDDMLLTVGDLPSGWSVDNSSDDEEDTGESDDSDVPECFRDLENLGQDDEEEAEIQFVGDPSGIPMLQESIGSPVTADDFTEGVEILNGCTDVSFESDGELIEGTIGELSIDPVGDESAAWRMSFEVQGLPFDFEFALVRVGNVGVIVAVADLGGVEPGFLDEVTATAVEKVGQAA